MKIFSSFLVFFFTILLSCSTNETEVDQIKNTSLDIQMIESYNEGLKILNSNGDSIIAAKKFNEAELLFPQSKWAPRSTLMAAYAYYRQDYYFDAISEIERYFKTYPNHNRKDYAYYLLALSYYDQIVDEKKDLEPLIQAKKNFEYLIKNYPSTDYALDAEYKLEVIEEILASKEIYLARYYIDKEKWVPAINRFKKVVNEYETSIYVEEALHRLVEIHYKLGLVEEAKKYANVLGYNYQSSKWYEKSYKIFNKKYVKKSKIKKRKNSIIDNIKSLID
tara:strand:+ start:864 stop:1697 length:834 start_codon:yes stop_codon:yes gene_type:complete